MNTGASPGVRRSQKCIVTSERFLLKKGSPMKVEGAGTLYVSGDPQQYLSACEGEHLVQERRRRA